VPELISVIVTTYNRADALDAVLRSLSKQGDREFEVVVADDGSTAATADIVTAWKDKAGRRLTHVWHEDSGFRAAQALAQDFSPEVVAHNINEGVGSGFETFAPLSVIAFIIMVWS